VFLRAGGYRAAHFAHHSGSADETCNLYHPYYGTTPTSTQVFPAAEESSSRIELAPTHGLELFLDVAPDMGASLMLRIPAARPEPMWSGYVRCGTPQGEARFQQGHLTSDQYIEVRPQLEMYRLQIVGAVDGHYGQMVSDGTRGLSTERSLFRVGDGFGKRMGWSEDLFWGESVLIVFGSSTAYSEFTKFAGTTSLSFEILALPNSFGCVEVCLPAESSIAESIKSEISNYLEHDIKPARSRLLVLDPSPHHFSTDGEWVVASGADRIRLFRSEREVVTVRSHEGDVVEVLEVSDDTVEFTVLSDGQYKASIRSDSILIRVAPCTFNQSYGVRLRINDSSYSLAEVTESSTVREQARLNCDTSLLEFESPRIAEITFLNGNSWVSNDEFQRLLQDEDRSLTVEVENYAAVCFPPRTDGRRSGDGEKRRGSLDEGSLALAVLLSNYGKGALHKIPINKTALTSAASMRVVTPVYSGVIPQLRWLLRRIGK
jgi:hypothetical protein